MKGMSRRRCLTGNAAGVLLAVFGAMAAQAETKPVEVGVFYFGNYHVDPRNEAHHGKGWTEWEYVKGAKPRFEGHRQPKVPLWGYLDEANPKDMAKKLDADPSLPRFVTVNSWNEWTEGSYIEPDVENGLQYLEAIRDVFGSAGKKE